MQFSAIFALSLALMASASPVAIEERTTGKDAQNTCSALSSGSTATCCNFTKKTGLLDVVLSLVAVKTTCGLVNVLSQTGCNNVNQKVFCCTNTQTTTQNGNVVALAVPVNAQCIAVA